MDITKHITSTCLSAGLDLVHPFSHEGRAALLIGNTKKLWQVAKFDPGLDHPVEQYVEQVLQRATADIDSSVAYSHKQPYIPIQRIAQAAGFAWLSKTHLSIHPVYGPWFALRAVIYLNEVGQPAALIEDGCVNCRCDEALAAAMQTPQDWRQWVALRGQCAIGQQYQYSDRQIRYHYTKDKRDLPV